MPPSSEAKLQLECTVRELAEEIHDCCNNSFAPPIEISMSDANVIAGWLYKTFQRKNSNAPQE